MSQFTCNFMSYSLNTATTISVILPGGGPMNQTHVIKEKFPVLYLLHGGFNDYSSWLRYTSVERYAEEHNLAVVTCSVMNSSYRNRVCLAKDRFAEQEAAFDAGAEERYFDFLEHELPEFVTSIFPVSTRPEDTYMAGLSMGGYGTILHGLLHPERFAALGFFSPMIFDRKCFQMTEADRQALSEEERRALLLPELVEAARQVKESGKCFPAIYLANGRNDVREFAPVFARLLAELGAPVTTDLDNKEFGHEWAFWDLVVKEFMDWLPRTDYYKDKRGRV